VTAHTLVGQHNPGLTVMTWISPKRTQTSEPEYSDLAASNRLPSTPGLSHMHL